MPAVAEEKDIADSGTKGVLKTEFYASKEIPKNAKPKT
ncbi:hypothetical protein RC62_1724 [Flavobacterium aquidurense]|uniref:Uncharacterized protein n=1 Tax=Flavobacterium aquidurense TaxID=362413 RepID=A0A0Q0S4T2_9FLAO|nr:hypothetical protein RC62_1724 [Flavobacterium aquidurense]